MSLPNKLLVLERVLVDNGETTGTVELCRHVETNEQFVRKLIRWSNREFAAREISISKLTSHLNVLCLVDSDICKKQIRLVYRYAAKGDLFDLLQQRPELRRDVPWVAKTFQSVVLGVQHMHQQGVLHRDLKLENVVVTEDDIVQVCDFSFAEWIRNPTSLKPHISMGITRTKSTLCLDTDVALKKETHKLVGTEGCISPETTKTCRASEATDVFSLGVLLYEMVTGRRAFVYGVTKSTTTYPSWLEQSDGGQLVKLIKMMLHKSAEERLSLKEILSSNWLTKHAAASSPPQGKS